MIRKYAMKKVFHLCHSSKEEVLFRSHDDYIWGFNSYALALYKTESCSFADAHMSNHRHLITQTDCPEKVMRLTRLGYTRHMNTKYKRCGPLGESEYFCMELDGIYHQIAAITYAMRNPLHHGVAATPFAYPHCSANLLFRSQLGKQNDAKELLHQCHYHAHVGRNVKVPPGYYMDKSGLFLRENVTAISQVELLYGTPRTFLYYMNRISDDKWIEEQKSDEVDTPIITVDLIEKGVLLTPPELLYANERGRANYKHVTDIQLCEVIDQLVVERYRSASVYTMSYSQKNELYCFLKETYHCNDLQLRRCLALNY